MLWYPINITKRDLKLAKVIVTQYGGLNAKENEKTSPKLVFVSLYILF
jgi:hypothetical protein